MKLLKNKKGVGVTSFIVAILLIGGYVSMVTSFVVDINDPLLYNKNLSESGFANYKILQNATNFTNRIKVETVGSESNTELAFLSLPLLAWRALRSLADGTSSAPNLVNAVATQGAKDLGVQQSVIEMVLSIFTITFIMAILGGVLRSVF